MKKIIILCLIGLAGQARAGSKPDWVEGPSAKYPRALYVVGVGLGDDRDSARDRARGEIARIFSSLVTVDTSLSETETNLKGTDGQSSNFSQTVSQNVRTASKKMLEGVEVVEEWKDEASKQHYALAVLERAKGRSALQERLADFDAQAQRWKAAMDAATEKLPRVKAAMKLLALLKARAEVNSELRVLDPEGKGQAGPLDEAALRPLAAKAVADLDVFVDASGSGAEAMETALVKSLNALGFEATAGSAPAATDILVESKVETKPVESADPRWKFARAAVTVSLKDSRTGKIFLRFDASDRQASADYNEAVRRALASLGRKVAPQVHDAVTDYFENQ
jgi:hypothetical protein